MQPSYINSLKITKGPTPCVNLLDLGITLTPSPIFHMVLLNIKAMYSSFLIRCFGNNKF
jgi:hypothetical protein